MTDTTEPSKLLEAAREAAAVSRGDIPAGRWTIKGHTYVPASEADDLRKQNQDLQLALSRKDGCMKDAMDILSRVKRGQNTKHVLQLRDDAVAFLKVGIGEEGKA